MIDLFRVGRGLELDTIQFLEGSGAPGASGDSSTAPVGSVFLDLLTGDFYTKVASGSGTDKWSAGASKSYVDSQIGTIVSWREPAVVRDNSSTSVPAGAAGNPIMVDGVSVTNGQRVLFSGISGGAGANVYIYDQATGVFNEDINNETVGDTLYIETGSSAGSRYTYNGTAWVATDQSSLDELQYIRTFIGKDAAGNITPNYSSINFVAQNSSLEDAVGAVDAELGVNVIAGAYIAPASKVNGNIQSLDTALGFVSLAGSFSNVTTITTVDSLVSPMCEWMVRAVDAANPSNVYGATIVATHNGVSVDATKYAVLKLGASISGLSMDVTLSGSDTLQLKVQSTAAVNVSVRRISAM